MKNNEVKVHELKVQPLYFDLVLAGTKDIEIRTYDERRQAMNVGDYIKFISIEDEPRVAYLQILSLDLYPTFRDLADNYDKKRLGMEGKTSFQVAETLSVFYPPEVQAKYGVVAIGIKVVPEKEITGTTRSIGVHPATKPLKKD